MLPISPYRAVILTNYSVTVFIMILCGSNLKSKLVIYHA
nr:MAG TPA: hypothetical protein [Microviridae sp.]